MAELLQTSYYCVGGGSTEILGAYHGIDTWVVNVGLLASGGEQLSVSLHEWLHRSLQHSTPWGLAARFAGDLARSGIRARQFTRLFRFCRQEARRVHETYATTLTLGGDRSAARALDANPEYREHFDTGMQLTGGLGWDRGRFLLDLALRACMAGGALQVLAVRGLAGVRVTDLDHPDVRPDARLAAVLRIAAGLPHKAIGTIGPGSSPDELGTAYDCIATHLTKRGLPTLDTAAVRSLVEHLYAEVTELSPALGRRLTVDPEPDPVLDRAEELQAETIVLHPAGPLPLELVPMEQLGQRAEDFTRHHEQVGQHVLLVWARADLLARQFSEPNALTGRTGFVMGLQASGYDAEGTPIARIGLFDGVRAGDVVRAMRLPVVFFTTMASIVDTPEDLGFEGVGTVFALADQPVVAQLQHTFAREATVHWHTYTVEGDRILHVLTWTVSALPGTVWLHVTGEAGMRVLAEWLDAQDPLRAVRAPDAFAAVSASIGLVVEHLVGTWFVIDQLGGRFHG